MSRLPSVIVAISVGAGGWVLSLADTIPPSPGAIDTRIREVMFRENEVYRLHGAVGYEIDLQFEAGERFVGLGAGDLEALSFSAQDNHLFLKPRAARVETNLTVLTTRRTYQIEYEVDARRHASEPDALTYSVRFEYPVTPGNELRVGSEKLMDMLEQSNAHHPLNVDYWFCGSATLKPVAASDDGVHTRLRFGSRAEQPAIFVRNEDGSESLLNFSMDAGDVILHRVAHQLIVRRGRLVGLIVNKSFSGSGSRLESGTVSPEVERETGRSQ